MSGIELARKVYFNNPALSAITKGTLAVKHLLINQGEVSLYKAHTLQRVSIAALFFAAACSSEPAKTTPNPYDQLCLIYKEMLEGKQSPGPATFQRLSDRITTEVPELAEHHGHLVSLPKEAFYPALKALAESELKTDWECRFIANYYR